MSDKELSKKLDKIEDMLRPLPDRDWTQADIAARLQVSTDTVRKLLKQPGAPLPLALQTDEDGSIMKARYLKKHVLEWIESASGFNQVA